MQSLFLGLIILVPGFLTNEIHEIPGKFQGVWKVVLSVNEDGTLTNHEGDDLASNPVEILIVGNRVVFVMHGGSSVVANAKVLKDGKTLTIELVTGVYHDKDQSPTYWNLNLKNDTLIVEVAIDQYEDDPRSDKTAVPSYKAIRNLR